MPLFIINSCDVNNCDQYDYIASSFIDTVQLGETILNGRDVTLVYFYPAGCNSFERIDCTQISDTLRLEAIFRFLYKCKPCSHGSGLDTIQYPLSASEPGQYIVNYRKNSTTIRNMPVYIFAPESLKDGRLMAMVYLKLLSPEDSLSTQIAKDLDIIRNYCRNDYPELANIEYRPPWPISEIRMEMDLDCDLINEGYYTDWDSLNAFYGLRRFQIIALSFCYIDLYFHDIKNSRLLAEAYGILPGVISAKPAKNVGDASNIWGRFSKEKNEYLMRYAYGDCPVGCLNEHYYLVEIVNGSITSFKDLGTTDPLELIEFLSYYNY